MEYINYIKTKAVQATTKQPEKPILSQEDEEFLDRITSDANPPPLPPRPGSSGTTVAKQNGQMAEDARTDSAQQIPLPVTPTELTQEPTTIPVSEEPVKNPKSTWNWLRRDSRDAKREATAAGLQDIAQNLKTADAKPNDDNVVDDVEAKKEEEDMMNILESLNLAAINNRVFSVSDETQELLIQFNQVFKDLVHGVPTAYGDLENLLKNGDKTLQSTYNSLPDFLQKLIEKLPTIMTKGFAPEIMAAASERATRSGFNMENAGKAAGVASKMGFKVPTLQEVVGKPGAITATLRSIMAFLRARFPAFMGMNVLWSLALFVLLFVFWYCYKRGKEDRLEKEGELTEQEVERLEKVYQSTNSSEKSTTSTNQGAIKQEDQSGIEEVEPVKNSLEKPPVETVRVNGSAITA